jgi:hypothetical protein
MVDARFNNAGGATTAGKRPATSIAVQAAGRAKGGRTAQAAAGNRRVFFQPFPRKRAK